MQDHPLKPSKPKGGNRQTKGVIDVRVTMTVQIQADMLVAFTDLASKETLEKYRKHGLKGRVTQRELQETAVKMLLNQLSTQGRLNLHGARHAGKRKTFWLSESLYEEMQEAAAARNIPATYIFTTACRQFLQSKGYLKD